MKRYGILVWALMLPAFTLSDASAGLFRGGFHQETASAACDPQIPALTQGYGADGPYRADQESVDNPGFHRKAVLVFLPKQAAGKRPVIFFSHGYGPGDWGTYKDLITHMVSLGDVVVFGSYPALLASDQDRYDALWQGFQAAAAKYLDRMDLTRVGFLGHSFGGGATPAMAYRGLVQQGWGKQGAFLMELAPWYAFDVSDAQLRQYPAHALHVVEVYDQDTVNDHRMAIDLLTHIPLATDDYLMVHSVAMRDCALTADHATPGRNPSLRQKQYAVFRPLDMLMDAAFSGSAAAKSVLETLGTSQYGYQPVSRIAAPGPDHPESDYRYPWSDATNPRSGH